MLEQDQSLKTAWTLGGDPDPERMLNPGVARRRTGNGKRGGGDVLERQRGGGMPKASSRSLTDTLGRWEPSSEALRSCQRFVILISRGAAPLGPTAWECGRSTAPRDTQLLRRGSAVGARSED